VGSLRLLLALACATAFALVVAGHLTAAERPLTAAPTVREVLSEINAQRARRSLQPLRLSRRLNAAADQHTREMGVAGYFSHDSADGSSFWERIRRFYPCGGYSSCMAGENILCATAGIDAARAVRLWMHSKGHRRNILHRSWREIGISSRSFAAAPGTYRGLDVTIVTTDFGTRARAR
jgi:uncharacterized protein YkwD